MKKEINVLNSTKESTVETLQEQERINVSNIPPKSIGLRELKDEVVIRRMTTTERNAMANVIAGTLVYNTTTNKLNFYNGSTFEVVTSV